MIGQLLSAFDVAIRSYLDQHHNLPSIAACDRRQWSVTVALAFSKLDVFSRSERAKQQNASFTTLPVSIRHARVEGWPTLPTFEFLFVPLFLAIGPFGCVLGPLFFRRLPLSFRPC